MREFNISRRTLIRATGLSVAGITLGLGTAGAATAAEAKDELGEEPREDPQLSENGWPIFPEADAGYAGWSRVVPGTAAVAAVCLGDVEVVLFHVVRRIHYQIATVGVGDVIGHRSAVHGMGQSNHQSGTAIDVFPRRFPRGVRDGFYPRELEVVRDILAECEGVVRWGGDFAGEEVEESHFQIDVGPNSTQLRAVSEKLAALGLAGKGTGTLSDPKAPERWLAARELAAVQS